MPNVRIPKDALYPKSHSKPIKSALTYELAAYGSMLRHAQEAFFSSAVLWRGFALDPETLIKILIALGRSKTAYV